MQFLLLNGYDENIPFWVENLIVIFCQLKEKKNVWPVGLCNKIPVKVWLAATYLHRLRNDSWRRSPFSHGRRSIELVSLVKTVAFIISGRIFRAPYTVLNVGKLVNHFSEINLDYNPEMKYFPENWELALLC